MRKKLALTSNEITKAAAQAAPYRLWDTKVPGLFVRVQPSGAKTFNVQWSRTSSKAIGKHPVMTVEGARTQALKILADAAANGTPAVVTDRRKPATASVRTLGDFIRNRYTPHVLATAKAGRATIDSITKQFGHLFERKLDSISRADFDDFKAKRLNAGVHPSTVNRDMDRLKAALSQAVDWGLLEANPLKGVKRIKRGIEHRVRFLSPDEEKALRAALSARDARLRERRESGNEWRQKRGREALPAIETYADHLTPMTLLALNTGLRRGEITQLTWADVDLDKRILTVRAGYAKSGKARHIPLNSEAMAVLTHWQKRQPKGRLFDVAAVTKSWAGVIADAGIEDFRFHDTRHSFASRLVMNGCDLNTVRELLGHGDIAMTLRYAHLAPEHKASAVEMLVT